MKKLLKKVFKNKFSAYIALTGIAFVTTAVLALQMFLGFVDSSNSVQFTTWMISSAVSLGVLIALVVAAEDVYWEWGYVPHEERKAKKATGEALKLVTEPEPAKWPEHDRDYSKLFSPSEQVEVFARQVDIRKEAR